MGDPVTELVPVIVQDAETGRVLMLAYAERRGARAGRAKRAKHGSGAARGKSSGTRAPPRGTRWRSRRSRTTATATRSSTAFVRTAPRATPARSRASRPGSGASSPSERRPAPRAPTSRACSGRVLRRPPARSARKASRRRSPAPRRPMTRLVEELADLWFHSYVLLAARGLQPSAVEDELRRRHAERG